MGVSGSNRFDIRIYFLVALMFLAGPTLLSLNAGNDISGKNLEKMNISMYNPEDLGLHTFRADLSFHVRSKGKKKLLSGYGSVLEQVKLRVYWKKPDLLQFRHLGLEALNESQREKANHMLRNFKRKYLYTLLRRGSIQSKITENRIEQIKKSGGKQKIYLRENGDNESSRSILSVDQKRKLNRLGLIWGKKVHWLEVSLKKVHHKTLIRRLEPVRNSAKILPNIRISYEKYRLGNDHKVRIGNRIRFDNSLEMRLTNVNINPDLQDVQFSEVGK